MNLVSDLDLPAFEFLGVTGGPLAQHIDYGIDKLPISWPGSSTVNPNHGPEPYVS